MKYQPVPPHEIMEGECYYITYIGISDKFYTIMAGTPPAEAQRVAADLDYQQHRESGRAHRALRDQVQHMQSQGAL